MGFKKQKASRWRKLNAIFAAALKRMVLPKLCQIAVALIVCKVFSNASAKQCSVGEVSKFGMMLQRHTFKRITGAARENVCYHECVANIRCRSFNYVFTQNICELNNRSKEAAPEDYVPNPERYYFKREQNRIALGSIPELPAETCQEIKMSEGGHVVSGRYCFFSIVPGKTVQSPCDMKTEGN
ncbi:uncharacterized protein LOC111335707 [Stylophora pistillata]|uniref:uncharacterized protein LOC111335707 n=1 Tax=Stylophora pistillata TaxID=50429 RepID=UPI000C054354|nr:uncharacterized protein LOC111335707 [Stylophora pistillata]